MSDKVTGFGKIFESIFERSLVGKGAIVFAVMSYVIAKQRPVGPVGEQRMEVTLNPALLGPILGEPAESVAQAIELLCSEDPDTHTPDEQGRRLVKICSFDYWVVNGMKYRDMRREESRRQQNREAQSRHRQKKKNSATQPLNGEAEFNAAVERGATQEELDSIVSRHLPPETATPKSEIPEIE